MNVFAFLPQYDMNIKTLLTVRSVFCLEMPRIIFGDIGRGCIIYCSEGDLNLSFGG